MPKEQYKEPSSGHFYDIWGLMGCVETHSKDETKWAVWRIEESVEDLLDLAKHLAYDLTIIEDFKSQERQQQWLAVRLLLEQLMPKSQISYKSNGQPCINGAKISISHSHHFVAVAINRVKDVGIDIQIPENKIVRIQHKFLTENELAWAANDLEKVTIVWSAKEAMYKLYGDCSPYFKQDYEVLPDESFYQCRMTYKGDQIIRSLNVEVKENYTLVLVND